MNVLDRNLNVQESYLLEASAGTGKTFSIENIVVRLLIDGDKPLLLDQILLVTFTKAATADLKKRIRQNLEKTVRILKEYETYDQIPDYVRAHIEKGEQAINLAIYHLKNALFAFDEAQIFTIHSFCSKMLHDNTIQGGMSLKSTEDGNTLLNSEVLDVIRNFFRTELQEDEFSKSQVNIVLKNHKSSIENVEKALLKWMLGGLEIKKTAGFNELFEQFCNVMKGFSYEKEKIVADFEIQIENYKKLKNHESGLQKVEAFAALFEKQLTGEDFDKLIQDGLYLLEALDKKQLKVKQKPLGRELFYPNLMIQLEEKLAPLIREAASYEMIFARMLYFAQKLLANYLKEEEKFRFDDLLTQMKEALKNEHFLSTIRLRYKAAIIDEFQDTDKTQWDIFNCLFSGVSPVYLVGDPKQSIYAFRQADIYTYLHAADTIKQEHRLTLDTNYRSVPSLTSCLNALFEKSVNPDFIELPKINQVLDFKQVKSPSSISEYPFEDNVGSVHFFIAEAASKTAKLPIEDFEGYYFPFMLQQIQSLQKQGFNLSQMAILVKDQFQSKRVFDYMQKNGVALALQRLSNLSDSSVHQSLIELLTAVISPHDESALKIALGGQLIGFTSVEILQLNTPTILEAILDKFIGFRKILSSFGFYKFFESFLKCIWNDKTVAESILSRENGSDIYEEFLQIAELVAQHESETKATPLDLLRFLKDFDLLSFDLDDRLKKLKDPEVQAIKVLTIHSSKGLEFDIVFALGLINRAPMPSTFIPVELEHTIILEPLVDEHSENYINFCKELDAEKLRQLYVAMTRAKYRLYVPVAFCNNSNGKEIKVPTASCIELFLAKMVPFRKTNSYEAIQHLNAKDFIIFLENFPKTLKFSYSHLNEMNFDFEPIQRQSLELVPPVEVHIHNASLYMTSFTKIAPNKLVKKGATPQDFLNEDKNRHTLPAGAKTGILLHSILESFPFAKYRDITDPSDLASFVHPYLSGTKFEKWKVVFQEMLFNLLNCSFEGSEASFKFSDIDPSYIYREQEFIYSEPDQSRFMNGVIDFMFLHEGKYYFIDWKSNWLGDKDEDYAGEGLEKAMIESGYYLQAEIYKQAIFRFLRIVEERDFEDCFGGIFYVFLRGLSTEQTGNGILQFK